MLFHIFICILIFIYVYLYCFMVLYLIFITDFNNIIYFYFYVLFLLFAVSHPNFPVHCEDVTTKGWNAKKFQAGVFRLCQNPWDWDFSLFPSAALTKGTKVLWKNSLWGSAAQTPLNCPESGKRNSLERKSWILRRKMCLRSKFFQKSKEHRNPGILEAQQPFGCWGSEKLGFLRVRVWELGFESCFLHFLALFYEAKIWGALEWARVPLTPESFPLLIPSVTFIPGLS